LACVLAHASVPLECNVGQILAGGASDPSSAMMNSNFSYTVYAIDRDQPIAGGSQVMDLTTWNSDHDILSMQTHSVSETADDPNTAKRTFSVSGQAVVQPCIYHDKFKMDDSPSGSLFRSGGQFIYADDTDSGWKTKDVTILPMQ